MLGRARINRILMDETITRSLDDEEARVLVEWLTDAAGRIPPEPEDRAEALVAELCRRGRLFARFVKLWCYDGLHGAATQLAVCEGLTRALPTGPTDAYRLMRALVIHEAARRAA